MPGQHTKDNLTISTIKGNKFNHKTKGHLNVGEETIEFY